MKKNFDAIEDVISQNDDLYYWAASYCKEHKCNVKTFYCNNRDEVDRRIQSLNGCSAVVNKGELADGD